MTSRLVGQEGHCFLVVSALSNMMHFVRTFSIMHAYGVRLIVIKEAQNYEKNIYFKNIFENGWWEDAYPSFYPLNSSLAISYKNHQKSLADFSHFPPLFLFCVFAKRKSHKRGDMAQCLHLVCNMHFI